jgi:hypothetical protein
MGLSGMHCAFDEHASWQRRSPSQRMPGMQSTFAKHWTQRPSPTKQ